MRVIFIGWILGEARTVRSEKTTKKKEQKEMTTTTTWRNDEKNYYDDTNTERPHGRMMLF